MGLDTVDLLLAVEDAFQIKISDQEAAALRTVDDLNACITRRVSERASSTLGTRINPEPNLTWPILVSIVMMELGVPREKVTSDGEWARDLGAK